MKKQIPIVMHDDARELTRVGTAQYDPDRGHITFRVDIDTLPGGFHLFGKAIDLGLVDSMEIRVSASEFGVEQVMALPDDESEAVEKP